MKIRGSQFGRLFVVFAVLVALASASWAHRVAPVPFNDDLSRYLAAGGTLDALCVDSEGTTAHMGQSCDACRLVDSVALPEVATDCRPSHRAVTADIRPRVALLLLQSSDPSRPVRGPPTA